MAETVAPHYSYPYFFLQAFPPPAPAEDWPMPPNGAPPPPVSPEVDETCWLPKKWFREGCHADKMRLCPHADSIEQMMRRFDAERDRVSQGCLKLMHRLSECLYGPQLLIPMEIASFLLLATASVVLMCTVLRCCCRYACAPASRLSASESSGAAELEEVNDDEDSQVTPLPVGVKHDELPRPEAEGADVLPSYNEVVDGAVVAARS